MLYSVRRALMLIGLVDIFSAFKSEGLAVEIQPQIPQTLSHLYTPRSPLFYMFAYYGAPTKTRINTINARIKKSNLLYVFPITLHEH